MSISIKRWARIDQVIEPVYQAFHFLMRPLTAVKDGQRDHVVVIKLFGLGSIVRFLGLCEESGVDLSRTTIVTSDSHKELCQIWGLTAVFIPTNSAWALARGCWTAIKEIRRESPRLIVDFERCSNFIGIFRTVMAWRAGCQTLSFEQRSLASRKAIVHSVDRLSQLQIFHEGIKHLPIAGKSRKVNSIPLDTGKIIVNCNASELLATRRYDLPSFATAISSIHQRHPSARFLLSGVKSERNNVQQLADLLNGLPVQNVAGDWTLERLMTELADCDLLITIDSAPLHLGKYMNVATLSIWGPTQPAHFGYPVSEGFQVASLAMDCSPCFLHPRSTPALACNGAITCIKQLRPDTVASIAVMMLSRSEAMREVITPVNLHLSPVQAVNAVE